MLIELFTSFIGGSLVTSVIFMFAFVSRITRAETTLANLCKTVDTLKFNRNVCDQHGSLCSKIAVLQSEVEGTRK